MTKQPCTEQINSTKDTLIEIALHSWRVLGARRRQSPCSPQSALPSTLQVPATKNAGTEERLHSQRISTPAWTMRRGSSAVRRPGARPAARRLAAGRSDLGHHRERHRPSCTLCCSISTMADIAASRNHGPTCTELAIVRGGRALPQGGRSARSHHRERPARVHKPSGALGCSTSAMKGTSASTNHSPTCTQRSLCVVGAAVCARPAPTCRESHARPHPRRQHDLQPSLDTNGHR